MAKNNRICKVCGKAYHYCPSCKQAISAEQGYEPWHVLVHDENCYKIFTVLQRHFLKELSDEDAYQQLKSCDLSVVSYRTTKDQVDAIMAAKKARTRKSKMETVIETN